MTDIMPDRYKGVFTNIHTKKKVKIVKVEKIDQSSGGFVIEFKCGDRWCMDEFCAHWRGDFNSA